jgi:drug/metabolite transporter (DMT)-like permease
MSVVFFKEKFTLRKLSALILAVIGCALTSGIIGGLNGSLFGVFMGVASGLAYSLYGIISTVALKEGATPISCTAFSFLFAAIGASIISNPINIATKTLSLENPFKALLLMITFSLCTAVIPYILYTVGLSGTKPDIAAIAASSEPVVASIFGVFVLNQQIDAFQIIGILFVISAITVLNLKFKQHTKSHL